MLPTGRSFIWSMIRDKFMVGIAIVAGIVVLTLLLSGCGSVNPPTDDVDAGDADTDVDSDSDTDSDVDIDVDTDADTDTDSDSDGDNVCGPDTWDLNCDGRLDPECIGPKDLSGESTYLELTPVIGTGETCKNLGIVRFSGTALKYPEANWGSFCDDDTATLLLPRGCYVYQFIGLSEFGVPKAIGLEFLRFPEETADELVVWPCDERNCPD